ncbi:MAG TPA: MOSC domain-containing protein [Myxococcota bacterium]
MVPEKPTGGTSSAPQPGSAMRVREIWRHPVKSMAGERLPATELAEDGVPGDRGWAVRDERRGGIRGAKKIPALMQLAARCVEEPAPGRWPAPEITLPDGSTVRADAPDAAARVSAALGTPVTLWPRLPASARDHYRRGAPDHPDLLSELRAIFGREPDEPLPDLSQFPPELLEFESPLGTYFDAHPLLLLSEASLRRLQELAPASRVDVRRFRPNLVIAGTDEGFPEQGWIGRRLAVGTAELEVLVGCPRCVMITHPFADLPRDPGLLRTVVKEANQNVGVYARVTKPGRVAVGDPVRLL